MRKNGVLLTILFFTSVIFLSSGATAATYTVTNCAGDGSVGSLLWAVGLANSNGEVSNAIKFNIPTTEAGYTTEAGASFWRIRTSTTVSYVINITGRNTHISGETQAAYIGGDPNPYGPEIVVCGPAGTPAAGDGITISTDECTIRNIVVSGLQGKSGIKISNGNYNKILGCYIGTHATGTTREANYDGIYITAASRFNQIGSTETSGRNVISGNGSGSGIQIDGTASSNEILGNYIGIKADNSAPLMNSFCGINMTGTGQKNLIRGNVISGNGSYGINIAGTNSNEVTGNLIGADATGNAAWGNNVGIYVLGGARYNKIGDGTTPGKNVISGNTWYGIHIQGSILNDILGNYIGTDVNGMAGAMTDMGNGSNGILLNWGSQYNRIGDGSAGGRNVVSGNHSSGVEINGAGTDHNEIAGNYIGTEGSGTTALSNETYGVRVYDGSHGNVIGPYNTIAYNGSQESYSGVIVDGATTESTRITRNSIFENTGLGILLANGGNNNMAAPTILTAFYSAGLTTVTGESAANTAVEIFSTNGPDPSGSGEGKTYRGATFEASGRWSIVLSGITVGTTLSATATDASNNTSMFSVNMITSVAPPSVMSIVLKDRTSGSTLYTNERTVSLEATGPFSADQMMISENSSFAGASWQAFANPTTFGITTAGDGLKTVYYKIRNSVGTETSAVSASITLDTTSPEVTVTAPTTGAVLQGNATFEVRWTATDNIGLKSNPITIRFSSNEGASWTDLADSEPNDGMYIWAVPDITTSTARIKVLAEDNAGWVGEDESGNFSILPRTQWVLETKVTLEKDRFNLAIFSPESIEGPITVQVFTASGLVATFTYPGAGSRAMQTSTPAYTVISWPAGEKVLNLPKGIYPVVVRVDGKTVKTYLIKP